MQAQQQPQETSPQHPGVVRLHVNAFYFLTTARWITSPTWGPPPPCKQAVEDEEAEIKITGSQIKQEAPGTNTFKMAEIEADDQ